MNGYKTHIISWFLSDGSVMSGNVWVPLERATPIIAGDVYHHGKPPPPVPLPKASPGKKRRRCGSKIVKWFGLRWFGVPYPVRLFRFIVYGKRLSRYKGCGCLVKVKAIGSAFRIWRTA